MYLRNKKNVLNVLILTFLSGTTVLLSCNRSTFSSSREESKNEYSQGYYNSSLALESLWEEIPEEAKPWVYWYWMHANVTREGITADLAAMAEQGIGGAYIFSIGPQDDRLMVEKPANPLTEYWWSLVDHAFNEAERLELKIAMNACDGWATAGSPDITPELSMQKLVWTETRVPAGHQFNGTIKQPETVLNYYRDIATIAFPEPVTSSEQIPKYSSNIQGIDPEILKNNSEIIINQNGWIQASYNEAIVCRSITVFATGRFLLDPNRSVEVSMDGQNWESIGKLENPLVGRVNENLQGLTFSVKPTLAKCVRIHFDLTNKEPSKWDMKYSTGWWPYAFTKQKDARRINNPIIRLRRIIIDEAPAIEGWRHKNGSIWRQGVLTTAETLPDSLCVPQSEMINLSRAMSSEGSITWEAPDNRNWIIQRIGHTSTGRTNHPAGTGQGLEPDKLNSASVPLQFYSWFGNAVERLEKNRKTRVLVSNHTDSWECGSQNWSPVFRAEFIKRCGYDPVRYLPAMTGVPISSAEISERFLYDIRQTIAQLVCENFYDPLVKLTHQAGARFSAEAMAPVMMSDGMAHFGKVDVPMGEFWIQSPFQDKPNDIQDAIHGARVYGKNIVQAEAFTQTGINWAEEPYLIKTMGDYNFALGINKFVLHVWAHKHNDRKPGITLPEPSGTAYGMEFSRSQTWWKPGKAWFDYLARSQALLQTGSPVIDVLYFTGENQPVRALLPDNISPKLPVGYTFNSINRDALLNQAKSRDGQLFLPGGISSRILVLPDENFMTPEVAEKIAAFAQAGVTVIGTKPDRSWSLNNYPQCDDEVRLIVYQGWEKVIESASLEQIFEDIKLQPDIIFENTDLSLNWREKQLYKSPTFSWGHRRAENTDIYFISNQEYHTREVETKFRVTGKIPELWNAETGEIRELTQWSVKNGYTSVNLSFNPAESYFIVFRKPGKHKRNQTPNFPEYADIISIDTPWKVQFQEGRGAPASIELKELKSLHLSDITGVKHFSGTSIYTTDFKLENRIADKESVHLNLGELANLAEVYLNGTKVGTLWTPPYRVDITKSLNVGANKLEIHVSNTWRNRIAGDLLKPIDERISWLPLYSEDWNMDLPLVESGLIGPVQIQKRIK